MAGYFVFKEKKYSTCVLKKKAKKTKELASFISPHAYLIVYKTSNMPSIFRLSAPPAKGPEPRPKAQVIYQSP
jgi:hypothetical protein